MNLFQRFFFTEAYAGYITGGKCTLKDSNDAIGNIHYRITAVVAQQNPAAAYIFGLSGLGERIDPGCFIKCVCGNMYKR